MQEQQLKDLLKRIQNGTATDEEKAFLENWYLQYREKDGAEYSLNERLEDADTIWAGLQPVITRSRQRRFWPHIAAAASILLMLSVGAYFLTRKDANTQQPVARMQTNDVTPGINSATLTLGNGQKIALNTKTNGKIAVQGNAIINKTANGGVIYTAGEAEGDQVFFNTIATVRKEKYRLTLADGTNVWLNAASSIRYPTAFTGNKREVEITGEAYFEVAHNASKPFLVKSKGQIIEVLGTHFNVNTYSDEPEIKTTLLEGSINIKHNNQSALLKPGQQATILASGNNIRVTIGNTKQAVAWKDNQFIFEHTELKTLMRQVARWYDLDIVYKGQVPNDEFVGQISRDVNLSKMLKILQSGDVHFEIVNENNKKKLIITP